jgi:hypothetical protein
MIDMSVVGTPITFDPNLVVELLRVRNGQLTFTDTIEGLKAKGFDESASRELIWHALAVGLVRFTDDRASLCLSQ